MWRPRKTRPAPAATPAVVHDYAYTATFTCQRPWQYEAIRTTLLLAAEHFPVLSCARVTGWDGHQVSAELTISVPWSPHTPAGLGPDATISDLIGALAIGHRLLWIARSGRARVAAARWQEIAAHPDLAEIDEHCTALYGDSNG